VKRFAPFFLVLMCVALALACSVKKDNPQECPSFEDYQIYPLEGGPDTEYELFVLLKNDSDNKGVLEIVADLYTSDGAPAGETYPLVRSDADTKRFLRSFTGEELCPEGLCSLFFRVIATHKSDCIKAFDTDIVQVDNPQGDDDTVSDDDAADDAADDATDDTTSDDTTADDTVA
jgi:hypothetical protein